MMNRKLLTYTITTIYILLMFFGVFMKSVVICSIVCGLMSIGALWLDYFMDKWREMPVKKNEPIKDDNVEPSEQNRPSESDVVHSGVIISEEELNGMGYENKSWFSQMSDNIATSVDSIEKILNGEDDTETEK